MLRTIAVMISLVFGGPLWAHSALVMSTPSDGAVLQAAPAAIAMQFNQGIRLTKVTLISEAGETEVDVSGIADFMTEIEMVVTPLASGAYQVDWRGLSADGHIQSGGFGFVIE